MLVVSEMLLSKRWQGKQTVARESTTVLLSSRDLGSRALLSSKLLGARFPLYRNQILQENTRWKALAEIYTIHAFAPFSDLEIFVKVCIF